MAMLTTKKRKKLSKSQFADPVNEAYPIHDAAHARNALARVSQQEKSGKLSSSKANQIRAKARKALNKFNKKKK